MPKTRTKAKRVVHKRTRKSVKKSRKPVKKVSKKCVHKKHR